MRPARLQAGQRPQITATVMRGAARWAWSWGASVLDEMRLPNGRRCDLFVVDARGGCTIVEVKSCLEDFRADGKWPDYLAWCDAFYIAVPDGFPWEDLPVEAGVILADGYGGACMREAPGQRLAPARRRSLTLRFARLAADRLMMAPPLDGPMALSESSPQ